MIDLNHTFSDDEIQIATKAFQDFGGDDDAWEQDTKAAMRSALKAISAHRTLHNGESAMCWDGHTVCGSAESINAVQALRSRVHRAESTLEQRNLAIAELGQQINQLKCDLKDARNTNDRLLILAQERSIIISDLEHEVAGLKMMLDHRSA
jgi:hypothetical protein